MNKVSAILCAAAILIGIGGCAASAQPAETMGVSDLASQRLTGATSIAVPGGSGFSELRLLVTVGVDGHVIDARADDSFRELDPRPGLEAARQWTFRPQSFDGHPVQAIGTITIAYTAPEIPPDPAAAFPVGSEGDVEIVLDRGACFGTCPDYRVSIAGDGRIRFSTREPHLKGTLAEVHRRFNGTSVLWPGTHEARVDPQEVAELVGKFRAAHFMGMKPSYVAQVTDNPTYALTLRVGRTTKRVEDYVGESVGMPPAVTELEQEVDRVAGTARWVRGDAATVAALKAEGFDFKSKAASELIQSALFVGRGSDGNGGFGRLIQAALAEGLDLGAPAIAAPRQGSRQAAPLGSVIAAYAAEKGDEALFGEMQRLGYVSKMGKAALDYAFTTEMGCSPIIARALVAAGASPGAQGSGGNALHALRGGYGSCASVPHARRLDMARSLIAIGVPLEARNDLGWTVLMGCDDPDLARLLIAAGAKVNARSADGESPILTIDDDRVALLLLRAGADPAAKDKDGSLREQARKHHWPATLAWLDAHGIA